MSLPVRHRHEPESPVTRRPAWSPTAELEQVTQRLARLVEDTWGSAWPALDLRADSDFLPPADLEETDDHYLVEVELPGVHKKDIEVEVTGRRLTVAGERKERERAGILRRRTRTVGRFFYELVLPGDVDEAAVSARLADGVLTVTVPKSSAERRPRQRVEVQ